jgi:hypothetical protein
MTQERKWTDHRLDDLAKKVDAEIAQADKPLGEFRGEVNERFEKVEGKIESGIKELRGETKGLGKELRGEIKSLRTSIYLGAGGIIAALVGISALA